MRALRTMCAWPRSGKPMTAVTMRCLKWCPESPSIGGGTMVGVGLCELGRSKCCCESTKAESAPVVSSSSKEAAMDEDGGGRTQDGRCCSLGVAFVSGRRGLGRPAIWECTPKLVNHPPSKPP